MYFPRMAASRFLVALGTTFKFVTSACCSAAPHLHDRLADISRTAVRRTFCAFSAFCTSVAIICAAVTDSCSGCQQSKRSEEHTSELQSPCNLVCRLLLEKKKKNN